MAMLERQQVFEDGVVNGAEGGPPDEVEFVAGAAGPGSSRHRLPRAEAMEGCASSQTMPTVISNSDTCSLSSDASLVASHNRQALKVAAASGPTPTSLNSRSSQSTDAPGKSDENGSSSSTTRSSSSQSHTTKSSTIESPPSTVHSSGRTVAASAAAAAAVTATAAAAAAAAATEAPAPTHARNDSPMVGMRGGLEGGGGPAEPIRGLAAFGSQGSINARSMVKEGGAGGSRLSPRRPGYATEAEPAVSSPGTHGRVSSRSGEGGIRRSAARSSSPYRVGKGAGSGGGSASVQGGRSPGVVPPRDPGYRVLQWSELSHVVYLTMGAMCEIYSAEVDGVKVAVKIPRKDSEEPTVAEHDLEVELDVLKRVEHKHILALVGAGLREDKPRRFLVLEYLELGTLADKLDSGSNTDGGPKESTFMRRQKRTKRYQDFYMVTMLERSLELGMALEYLHHHLPDTFVVHRDLKPDNVGFKADGTLKLFDFGLARVVKRRNRVNARYEMTGETGSMRYMAPEVVESLPYNEKVDVYGFGLVLWEMLEDRRVFDGIGITDFYDRVVNAGARPNLDPEWPQDLRKLISQCWHADVDRRPNFKVITERLRVLYNVEKHSNKLCMSALNLNEDEHPKLRGGSSLNMLVRSATATNVVNPRTRGGGPSSQTETKKGGILQRSFSKMGRMFHSKKGGAKPTLTHTAPEAYSRKGHGIIEPTVVEGESYTDHNNGGSELDEQAIYGRQGGPSRRVSDDGDSNIRTSRAQSEGTILKSSAQWRRR